MLLLATLIKSMSTHRPRGRSETIRPRALAGHLVSHLGHLESQYSRYDPRARRSVGTLSLYRRLIMQMQQLKLDNDDNDARTESNRRSVLKNNGCPEVPRVRAHQIAAFGHACIPYRLIALEHEARRSAKTRETCLSCDHYELHGEVTVPASNR